MAGQRLPKSPIPELDDLLELRHQAHTLGLASHHPVNTMLCGLYASVFRGQGLDFEEVREYREGDEIRNMDWRVTARTGTPHLKVFREERERTVMLCVDSGPHMRFGTRGSFKSVQAARAAALLGWAASSRQDRVGALLFGDPAGAQFFQPSRARRALWRMLRSLAQPGATGSTPGDPMVDSLRNLGRGASWGTLVLVIGDFNRDPEALEQPIGRLRQRNDVVLIPVDDIADWKLPPMGKVVFASPSGARLELDTDSTEGRRRYREAWELRRDKLRRIATRLGADLLPITTHEDVHRTLTDGLRWRARHQVVR